MKSSTFLFLFCFLMYTLSAQDTFSIVAVDPETGEVGGAGGTCLDIIQEGVSVIIISDILPGKGAINTQSFWNSSNQSTARNRMEAGDSPEEIMSYLQFNDVQFNPLIRQYGAADFGPDGMPRAAAFTGENCFDFKGQIVGENYAIQGNILIGAEVLTAMEEGFLADTSASLAQRLMMALQGANIPGADERCLEEGVSSRSTFLRVARPDDEDDDLYLDLEVPVTPFGVDPIDSIQVLFDAWLATSTNNFILRDDQVTIFPNPTQSDITISLPQNSETIQFIARFYDTSGKLVHERMFSNTTEKIDYQFDSGAYILQLVEQQSGILLYAEKVIVF